MELPFGTFKQFLPVKKNCLLHKTCNIFILLALLKVLIAERSVKTEGKYSSSRVLSKTVVRDQSKSGSNARVIVSYCEKLNAARAPPRRVHHDIFVNKKTTYLYAFELIHSPPHLPFVMCYGFEKMCYLITLTHQKVHLCICSVLYDLKWCPLSYSSFSLPTRTREQHDFIVQSSSDPILTQNNFGLINFSCVN